MIGGFLWELDATGNERCTQITAHDIFRYNTHEFGRLSGLAGPFTDSLPVDSKKPIILWQRKNPADLTRTQFEKPIRGFPIE